MGKQNKKNIKNKSASKNIVEKKHLIDPRYKNTFWTVVILIVLIIFFIVNNTKSVPDRGPYPPNYIKRDSLVQNQTIDSRINFDIPAQNQK
jgi:hypothetical protein